MRSGFSTRLECCSAILVVGSDRADEDLGLFGQLDKVALVQLGDFDTWLDTVWIQLTELVGDDLQLAL